MEPSPTAVPVDPPAVPLDGPAARPEGPLRRRVVVGATVAVLSALAVLLALVGAFLLPPLLHPTLLLRLTLAYALAIGGNLVLALYAGRAGGSRLAGSAPALAWVITVVYFAAGRGEGDTLYLAQTYQGIFFLPIGLVAAASGIARSQRPPGRPGQDRPSTADK